MHQKPSTQGRTSPRWCPAPHPGCTRSPPPRGRTSPWRCSASRPRCTRSPPPEAGQVPGQAKHTDAAHLSLGILLTGVQDDHHPYEGGGQHYLRRHHYIVTATISQTSSHETHQRTPTCGAGSVSWPRTSGLSTWQTASPTRRDRTRRSLRITGWGWGEAGKISVTVIMECCWVIQLVDLQTGFHCKQQVYWEQRNTFPDYFGCRYLCILYQTSRLKQTFEEKTKLKFNPVDI